jgi:tetratricopeptide (TPR) repeat protein
MAAQEAEKFFQSGIAAYRAGNLEAAVADLEEATRLDPEYVDAFKYLGAAYGSTGKYNQAVGAFKVAEQLSPQDPRIHYNIAQAHEAAGNPAEAEYEYGKALEVDPKYGRAHQALMALRARMGKSQ